MHKKFNFLNQLFLFFLFVVFLQFINLRELRNGIVQTKHHLQYYWYFTIIISSCLCCSIFVEVYKEPNLFLLNNWFQYNKDHIILKIRSSRMLHTSPVTFDTVGQDRTLKYSSKVVLFSRSIDCPHHYTYFFVLPFLYVLS